jgi:hypothetical protein
MSLLPAQSPDQAVGRRNIEATVLLALIGKIKGWDRTKPIPAFDWKTATLERDDPSQDDESSIALCLASLLDQDFRIPSITMVAGPLYR